MRRTGDVDTQVGAHVATGRELRPERVGYKLARLAQLAEAGLPVPAFYAVPVECFQTVVDPIRGPIEAELHALDFADPAAVQAASDRIRTLFVGVAVPTEVQGQILAAFDRSFGADALVAVRASTVSTAPQPGALGPERAAAGQIAGEDSAQDAFAGMSDSFLYVPRQALLDRIRRCWASGFNAESLLYRQVQGLDPARVEVAVGIQQMALGERSFVMFTCDPRSGARDTIVAAAYGIGEGVVQERVGVDHFFLRSGEPDGTVERRIVAKPERLGLDPARPEAGPVPLPVAEELRDRPVLNDAEVGALADLGRRVERLFGVPQDIEGTFTADGEVHLVQTRPITVDLGLRRQWSSANVTESFPGVTTALTYSFAQTFYAAIFYDLYRRLGVDPRTLHRNQVHLDRMIGLHRGRVYYELNAWYHLHSQLAVFPLFRASWERMMGITDRPADADSGPAARWYRLAWPMLRVIRQFAVHDRTMADFETWWEAVIEPRRGRDWSALDPLARIDDFHRVWAAVQEHWGVTLINDSALSSTATITERLLERWVPGADHGLLSDLLCGDEDNHSVATVLSLVRLAELARSSPALLTALASRPVRDVWRDVERGTFGPELLEGISAHLHRYGDRGLQELKMEQPNLRQTPWELLRLVGEQARTNLGSEELRNRELAVRAAAEKRLAETLQGGPLRRWLLQVLLARLRRSIRYRENSRYCRSELFGLAKGVFHALGEDLAAQGVLRHARDVVHLTQDELFGYFDGTGVSENLQSLADARRAEFDAAGPELPIRFSTLGAVRATRPAGLDHDQHHDQPGQLDAGSGDAGSGDAGSGTLRGLGSSGGKVRGIARVILDPRDHLDPGEGLILVARETDPGWLFLMLGATGIIVERGTMLSHTAITGRKFGIPTIVSLPAATTTIPDGAMVEMDGASGLVTILASEPA